MTRSCGTAVVALLVACGSKPSPPPPTGTRIGPAIAAALDAAARHQAPWLCAVDDGPGLPASTITGKRTWTVADHAITTTGEGALTIGFVADAGGAAPTTLAALGRLRGKLADVDLVIALGGMGTTQAELEATLGVLVGANAPLVALPGDLESARALTAAIGKLAATNRHVIDGRLLRRIELPTGTIATLSGGLAPARLVAGVDGCLVRTDDVTAMFGSIAARPGLRIVASTEAPRMTIDGEPVGDRALLAPASAVDVVVHAPVAPRATPVKTGARDGKAIALSPGTSDATARLPGPRVAPSAGILTITKGSWSWRAISDADPQR